MSQTVSELPVRDQGKRSPMLSFLFARKDRRKGSRVNRVAPRSSRLQIVGLLATIFAISVAAIVVIAAVNLEMAIPITTKVTVVTLVALSFFVLAVGSIEQRLIEIRLELMMLNGGQRRADRTASVAGQ